MHCKDLERTEDEDGNNIVKDHVTDPAMQYRIKELIKCLELSSTPQQDDFIDRQFFGTTNAEWTKEHGEHNFLRLNISDDDEMALLLMKALNGYLLMVGDAEDHIRQNKLHNEEYVADMLSHLKFEEPFSHLDSIIVHRKFTLYPGHFLHLD